MDCRIIDINYDNIIIKQIKYSELKLAWTENYGI